MIGKELFLSLALVLTFISYGVYLFYIFKGETRPHPFSWLIWSILTLIAFFAQLSDGAGFAVIVTGFSSFFSFLIALIGYIKKEDITITKSDLFAFVFSLLTIPLWIFTETPLWSILLVIVIDVVGFYPTFRKTWDNPEQESLFSSLLTVFKHLFTILSIAKYTLITSLFPFALLLLNTVFILLISIRRWQLNKPFLGTKKDLI